MKTAELLAACDQALAAVANGTGAGVLLAMVVGCSLRAAGGTNAATRHALWFGTLLLLVAMIPAQFCRERLASVTRWGLINHDSGERSSVFSEGFDEPEENTVETTLGPGPESAMPPAGAAPPAQRGWWPRSIAGLISWLKPSVWKFDLRLALSPLTGAAVLVLWAGIAAIKATLLIQTLLRIRRLKRTSTPPDAELAELFEQVRARLGVSRKVELRVSSGLHSALVLGFVNPVILFPAEETADLEAAEQVIGHELAHIWRADDWANLVQRALEAFLFFHPAVWWIGKRLALEREIASDDFVLEHGAHPQKYALLLVNFAGRRHGRQPLLAPAVSTGKHQLQQRIAMILNAQRNTSSRLAKAKVGFVTAVTVLAGVLVFNAGPRVVLGQSAAVAEPAEANEVAAAAAAERAAAAVPAESGPRFKDAADPADEPRAVPVPRREPRTPSPAAAPRVARAPEGASVEERLDRLERMVRSLAAQQKRARAEAPAAGLNAMGKPAPAEDLRAAKRESARAAELEKRASKQVEKAIKYEEKWRAEGSPQDVLQAQLQALHQARETLQRELEKLEHQIEQIKRDQEHHQNENRARNKENPEDGQRQ